MRKVKKYVNIYTGELHETTASIRFMRWLCDNYADFKKSHIMRFKKYQRLSKNPEKIKKYY